ncbi:MAG: Methyltransferase type 11 [Phycisphaerales bacterium]|nr:Methyltransferase type 11 [Phycisphaerales bacterium]
MNWKLKAHALAVLSRVPAGRFAYHRLQRLVGTNSLDAREGIVRSLEIIKLIREAGADPRGRIFLEIGTGWRPFLPLILYLIGAKRTITFDINPWMDATYAFETYGALRGHLDFIAEDAGVPHDDVRGRYDRIMAPSGDIDQLLEECFIEYRCPGDAGKTGLAEGSIDFVCSSNVLEHIPPDELERIHREAFRVLRREGLAVHRFNPQDHYSGVDRTITGANFLQYSQEQWHWYGGEGLAYHNRLRCAQHEKLLHDAGFVLRVNRVRIDERARAAIEAGRLSVHHDFAGFTAAQLAADYMWLVGERTSG